MTPLRHFIRVKRKKGASKERTCGVGLGVQNGGGGGKKTGGWIPSSISEGFLDVKRTLEKN